jgi:hypothetical protein
VTAEDPGPPAPAVLFLADSDSQIFGTAGIARAFKARGWTVTYGLFETRIPENARQLVAAEFEVVDLLWPDLMSVPELSAFDAIGVYSFGSRIQAFREWFVTAFPVASDQRPVIFTGFNGLILEKFEEGVAWRAGYDVLAVGGWGDEETFRALFGGSRIADQPIAVCGLGYANMVTRRKSNDGRRRLVFAEQAIIPKSRAERLWLLAELCRIADASPTWDVIVKVRATREERTFHAVKNPVEDILYRLEPVPENLKVEGGSLAASLENAELMMTVSSTAAFEALRSGIPVATVGDLGINNALGTHVFLRSGLLVELRSIGSLDDFVPPTPNPDWLRAMGLTEGRPDNLVVMVEALRESGRPIPTPLYGSDGPYRVPVTIAHRSAVAAGLAAIEEGRLDDARRELALARRLRPDDFVAKAFDDVASGRRPAWALPINMVWAQLDVVFGKLTTKWTHRRLRRRPPVGPTVATQTNPRDR